MSDKSTRRYDNNDDRELSKRERERNDLRMQVRDKYIFWSSIAVILCSWLYMGSSTYNADRNDANVLATVTALSQDGNKFTEQSVDDINRLQPTTLRSSVLIAVDYNEGLGTAECEGSIIDMKPSGEGSLILLASAQHCIPDSADPDKFTIATINDVTNVEFDRVNEVGTKFSIKEMIPFGSKSLAIVLKSDIPYEELWEHSLDSVGIDNFLGKPQLREEGEVEALMYIGGRYIPVAVTTNYTSLGEYLATHVNGHHGVSGLNFFDNRTGKWVGTLENRADAINATNLSVPSEEEKERVIKLWLDYPSE